MIFLTVVFVFFGLLFPFFSALSGALFWKRGKGWSESPSPIFIPVFGPMLLSCAIVLNKLPMWLVPIAWMTDLGTLVFLWYLPAIIREEWKTSRFTCVLRIKGNVDNTQAVLTLHTSGRYLLRKSWVRPKGKEGVLGMGELGTYAETENGFVLSSFEVLDRSVVRDGRVERRLVRTEEGYLVDEETDLPERCAYHTLRNWVFRD